MGSPFDWKYRLFIAIWCMVLSAEAMASNPTGPLEPLCRPDALPETVIESLVEEAEAAGMPEDTLNRLLAVGYREVEASETLRILLCVIVQAEEDGLPPGLLFETLAEGLGKKVPLPRILAVIRTRVEDLEYARSLLAGGPTGEIDNPDVERVARVLALGNSRKEISAIFGSDVDAPDGMRVIAVEILGYGRAMGIDRELIDRVNREGLARRAFSPDWAYFVKVVSAARKAGIPDARVADTAVEVLSENGTLDELIGELGLTIKNRPALPDD